ncbi:MAG TPA: DUF998 domain-containing protein [Pseudolysinimonas sp.]|nr:DUF998 domain-containing protein [Pseudolysinimonas sp.]
MDADPRPRPSTTAMKAFAVLAVLAQLVFTATWLVAPLWQGAGYNVLAHSISDMYAVTAPNGVVLVVVFTVCGALTILFALLAVLPALRSAGWTAVAGAILLALSIFGLGDLLSPFERLACRLADPGCTSASQIANAGGATDAIVSTVGVILFIAAAVLLSVAMQRTDGWRAWVWPARVVAIVVIAVFFAEGLLGASGVGGLLERVLAAVGAISIGVLAARISRR